MKTQRPFLHAAILFAACSTTGSYAQSTKYWVGGSGNWGDAAHWSLTAGGPGGAGTPRASESAWITGGGTRNVHIGVDARCLDLVIDATHGRLVIDGAPSAKVELGGGLRAAGEVDWRFRGDLEFINDNGGTIALSTHGIGIASDLILDGDAIWEMHSALVLRNGASLTLKEGTLRLFDGVLQTSALRTEGRAPKRIETGNAYVITDALAVDQERTTVDAADALVMKSGQLVDWSGAPRDPEEFRGITNCGTGAGQTPFQVNAFVTSNYNGFGVSCNGACDGAVSVTVTGGSGTFNILWQGGPSTNNWGPICAGNKLVIVTDVIQNVGCFASALITPPPPLGVLFFGLNPPTCADVCNGTAVTFPGGGTGAGYAYDWNNGTETSSNPVQLCAGVNTLQLSDNNNCVFDTSFTIDLLPVAAVLTVNNALCSGDCDGTGHVDVTGGTPNYTFNWEPGSPTGDGTADVTGLCPGNYTVLVADANGCDTTIAFTIIAPPPIVPNLVFTNATCFNSCDGTAGVTPSGAAGPYSFNWGPDPITGDGTGNVNGLCAGNYTVLITDLATGCDTLVPFTIGSAPAIDVQLTVTDATCSGSCDGAADIAISGGTPGYVIVWTPNVTGQGTPSASQLCPGDYTVTVTDAANCDTTLQFTITQPPPVLPNETFTDVRCFGQCNGTIDLAPSGGTGTYSFTWTPAPPIGDGTANGAGLCAQPYSITISDSLGCDTTVIITINQPPQLIVTPTQSNITCGSNCDGTAGVTVSGGTPDYTFDWSGSPAGDGTDAVTALCAGVYTVQVLDSALCEVIQTFIIQEPLPIQVTLTTVDATCPNFCNGTADALVTGGNDPYTYVWDPAPGTGQGSPNVTGLCAQDYTLLVTDSVNCDTTVAFTISAPLPIDPQDSVTNVTCAGSCDGSIILDPLGGFGNFTYTWTPIPANGQGTSEALGLCAGTWSVLIADGVCDTTLVFNITEPAPIDAGLLTTPAGCDGTCDGTATSNTIGGTPDYDYVWSPAPGAGQGTAAASQFCPGNYQLTITDDAGCDTTIAFLITQPPAILPSITTTLASCGGACDGSATVGFTGGTGTVVIVWTPQPTTGQGTTNATGFCPGVGSVTLTDSLGCDTTLLFIIGTPSGIVAVPNSTDASCADACDGAIDLAVSGGVPGYDYTWNPVPPSGADSSVSGLCPGQWTVQIGDQAGCDTTLIIDIGSPTPILPNGTFTNETCNGPCDGTASVAPTGGAGGYGFAWSPTPGTDDGNGNVSGLCAGDWSVTITDASGCDTTWTFTVLGEQPILPNLTVTAATCFNICNGTASVAPTGGSGGFTYAWTPQPPVGQGTDSVSGLCLGQWNVTITDSLGCDTTVSFIVNKPAPITTSLAFTAANCNGPCTGQAAAFPSGGTPGFTFFWQPAPGSGQGTFYVDGLCAGTTYSLTVTDTLGCDTTETFTIPDFTPISPNLGTTPVTCSGDCDGTASLAATGGSGTYTYDWTPAPPSGDSLAAANALCAGVYDVVIADSDGCDTTVSILITSPAPIDPVPTVVPIACHGDCNGAISLATTGGTGGLTYSWTPQPPVGQGTANVTQLCPGDWTVTITDSVGCDTTMVFSLTDPSVLSVQAEVIQSQCQACNGAVTLHATGGGGGYFFAWGPPISQTTTDSTQTGLCAGIYTVIIGDALNCVTQIAVPISDSDGEDLTVTSDTVTCPTDCDGLVSVAFNCGAPNCAIAWFDGLGTNLNASGNSLSGLCAGLYLVQVTNGSGCLTIDSASVSAPEPIAALFGTTPVSCAGLCDGTATVGIAGGIAPYQVSWDPLPGTGQGTTNVSGLCAGTYDVTISDAAGCSTTATVLILGPQPIDANAVVQDISCAGACDGSITLNAQGGSGSFSYLWNPQPPNGQGGSSATQLCAGNYTVTVIDANGCDSTLTFTIAEPQPLVLDPSATSAHCQVCDGTGAVQVSGGTGSPTITWTDAGGLVVGSGASLTGLCAGIYTVNAQDTNGCSAQTVVVISDATGEALTVTDGQTTCADNCDGQVSVSFTCSDGPCTISWFDGSGQLLVQNQFGVADLCTGNYFVQVVNNAGCAVIDTATVSPSQQLIPNLTTTPVSCSGDCDGTATVGPVGGVLPYTYDWGPDPITGDGTPSVSGLCPGAYTLLLADSSGCDTTLNILITGPAPFAVTSQTTQVSCNATCDGAISVIAAGGTGGLSFTWDPVPPFGQGTGVVSGLCAGDRTVTINDSLGCDTAITFTINEPPPLVVTTASTLSTCGICSGTMSATPSGGTPGYSYNWTQGGSIFGTDSLLTNVCAGLYQVVVSDANGCQVQQAVPVNDSDGEILDATSDIVTCPGACDGSVSVVFNCSAPTCAISWLDVLGNPIGETSATLDTLCPGSYFVQVINGNGCLTIDTAFVSEPQPILPNLSTTQPTCAGECDGTATVGPAGGVAPYSYDWSPDTIAGDSTSNVTGLCAGGYTLVISDSVGCTTNVDVLIIEPTAITATATLAPITCNGACDATISLVAAGGTGQLEYLWSPDPGPGQGTDSVFALCAGDWTVVISDTNGCDTTFTFSITDPPVLLVDMSTSDNLCFGDCAGSASAAVSGGTAPYTFTWTTAGGGLVAQGDTAVGGLCAGDYILQVVDTNGCVLPTPFSIGQGAALQAALAFTGETCNGPCDGVATVQPGGGAGGYSIAWIGPDGNVFATDTAGVSGLCAGNWTVTITDSLGCDSVFSFTLLPYAPIQPNEQVTQILCHGACNGSVTLATTGGLGAFIFDWTPTPPNVDANGSATGLCPGDWSVTITDGVDCDTTLTFTITEPEAITIALDGVVNASCNTAADGAINTTIGGGTPSLDISWTGPNGFSADTDDINSLVPGDYTVTVQDANGCTAGQMVNVGALSTVLAAAGSDIQQCFGAPLILNGASSQGAVDYLWTDDQGNTIGTQPLLDLGVPQPGAYSYILTVSDGPCSDDDTVLVNILALPFADAGPDQDIFLEGSVTLGGQPSGPPGSAFHWSPDSLLIDASLPNPASSPANTTWFTLSVTTPSGCTSVDSVLVTVVPEIVIPSGFTPNGDGSNEVWQIDFIDQFPDCTVEVYNRWGEQLFRSVGYRTPWDGTYSGGPVPVGTYYYAIELNDESFPEPYTGPLTVIR